MKLVISSVAFVACFSLSTFVSAQGRGQAGGAPAGHGGGVGHAANTRTETKADIGQKITEHPKLASKLQSLLPAGTMLHVISWHNNTASNRFNPDPEALVTYGQRTIDEMGFAWVRYYNLSDEEFKQQVEARKAKQK